MQSPHSATHRAVKANRAWRGASLTRTRPVVAAKRKRRRVRGRMMRRVTLCWAAALAWRTRRAWKRRLLAMKVREKSGRRAGGEERKVVRRERKVGGG